MSLRSSRAAGLLACVALGALAGLIACDSVGSSSSGSFVGGGGSSTGVSDVPSNGASGVVSRPECPSTEPSPGEFCPGEGACEYGGASDPSCNTIATCRDQRWKVERSTYCPVCPTSFDKRAPGETCGDPDVCTYLEATCGCVGAIVPPSQPTSDGGSDEGGDASDPDAGDPGTDAGAPLVGHWQCVRPGNGCPARRPVAGAACVKAGTVCDYGTCLFGVTLTYECTSGEWVPVIVQTCP